MGLQSGWRELTPGMSGIEGTVMAGTNRRTTRKSRSKTSTKGRPKMAKRKKRKSSKARKASHKAAPRKTRKHRSHRRPSYKSSRRRKSRKSLHVTGIRQATLMGGAGGIDGPIPLLLNVLAFGVGLLGGSLLGGKIPAPEKLKPAIPLALGIGGSMLPQVRRIPFAKSILMGMAGAGLLSYGKMLKPDLPYLTGEHTDLLGAQASLSGEQAELMGAIAELGYNGEGDMDLSGERSFVTSASL